MTTLAELSLGQRGVVRQIAGGDPVSLRLLEMGLTPGCQVEFLRVAPLGDPIEVAVRGYRLSLRKTEALRVEVTVT